MLQVNVFAAHFVRNVVSRGALADQLVIRDRFQRRRSGECEAERLIADQFAVCDGTRAARRIFHPDGTARYRQALDGRVEFFRRKLEQRLARLGGCRANCGASTSDGRTRVCATLIRRDVRIETDRADLAHVQVELFGRDLQKRRRRALPELDVADVDGRRVVGVDGEPCINLFWIGRTSRQAARDRSSLRAECAAA